MLTIIHRSHTIGTLAIFFIISLNLFHGLASPTPSKDSIELDSFSKRVAPPPPRVPPPNRNKPNKARPGSRVCRTPTCEEDKDAKNEDGPTTIEVDIPDIKDVEYPKPKPEAKIKKREKEDPKGDGDTIMTQCFGEVCVSNPPPGLNQYPQVCTHMAKRPWSKMYWTCCREGYFAAFDGSCCARLDAGGKFCK